MGHVHFNLATALWTYIVLLLLSSTLRFLLNKFPVNGLTELVNSGV